MRATTAVGGLELWWSYDKLVVAVGAAPHTVGILGVKEHTAVSLARAAGLLRHRNSIQKNKYDDEITRLLWIIVVSGGPQGVTGCMFLSQTIQTTIKNPPPPPLFLQMRQPKCHRLRIFLPNLRLTDL